MPPPDKPKKIACAVCRAEIPEAAALHAEGQGYLYHFCDTECFGHWNKARTPKRKKAPIGRKVRPG